ncbi:MAG: DNA recombination protein RmuC [Candidatus Methylomirabilales bacterium]
MPPWTVTLLILGIALLLVLGVSLGLMARALKGLQEDRNTQDPSILLLQQQVAQFSTTVSQGLHQLETQVSQRLQESALLIQQAHQSIGERLDRAAAVVGGVQGSLGKLDEATRRMLEVGQDIASLQQILRPPQLRGSFGETLLEQLLSQILPADAFRLQHAFRSGERVDAVIRLGSRLVPVDAKFPLENFQKMLDAAEGRDEERRRMARKAFLKDVQNRVNEIAKKYIVPDEGTLDFALMYIPAENVYYEVIVKDEMEDSVRGYAYERRVVPVSPNSFYAYLQTILLGLKGLRIEQNAREIMELLARLQVDLGKFRERFDLAGKHLTDAKNRFDDAAGALARFEAKLDTVEGRGEQPGLPGVMDSSKTLPS